ncbi:hydrolase TatD [Aliikangiella marina]|uniref:Hydrolase TatD n=2 Tax=Aliikangiella marina TaxID=1712262 RepID=A0A545TEG2_9GAMM|nr:hydrolase TatD [Aliikangiella marina]
MANMTHQWVDIGINLTNKRYDKDRDSVVTSAIAGGVTKLIITGTNVKESQAASKIAQSQPTHLYATAGCHPHDSSSLNESGLQVLKTLLELPNVVAVGECGLDFNRNFSTPEEQIAAFTAQLELATDVQKPLFLHERDAFDTQQSLLQKYLPKIPGGVAHCFTGSKEHMQAYLDMGLYIGITGWICDERRGLELLENVHLIPDDRILLETDGPYLTPRNLKPKPKGGRNEPKFLPHIAAKVAQARGQTLAQLSTVSYQNSCRLFRLESAH